MATRPSRKPPPQSTGADETRRTNMLLESLRKEITLVAEGVVDVRRRLKKVEGETALLPTLRDEVKSLGDVLRSTVDDLKALRFFTGDTPRELEAVKTELRLVRSDLSAYAKRLETAEARLPA